jgi:hypothetical protein
MKIPPLQGEEPPIIMPLIDYDIFRISLKL